MRNSVRAAYVHIPFCSHICYYCDFSKVLLDGQPVDDYLTALLAEWESYQIRELRTLYIGGGTPTVLTAEQMQRLLSGLTKDLDLSKLEEFTVEANPSDLTDAMIEVLADSPVNRLSLGVQTFNDQLLKKIGRKHTASEALSAVERLRAAGFDNLTIDLIYALPSQTLEMLQADVAQFLALDIPHVALYSLILEDHTRFMNLERQGKLHLPSEDREADMYEWLLSALTAAGYEHYEVSNFAKKGYESKHNLTYWDNEEYYGIGAGASGYLDGVRYKNHGPIQHYINAVDKRVTEDRLSQSQQMEEEMFLGLRKAAGVSISHFDEKFAPETFDEVYAKKLPALIEEGLIELSADRIFLTERGFELGNEVFQEFLLDEK